MSKLALIFLVLPAVFFLARYFFQRYLFEKQDLGIGLPGLHKRITWLTSINREIFAEYLFCKKKLTLLQKRSIDEFVFVLFLTIKREMDLGGFYPHKIVMLKRSLKPNQQLVDWYVKKIEDNFKKWIVEEGEIIRSKIVAEKETKKDPKERKYCQQLLLLLDIFVRFGIEEVGLFQLQLFATENSLSVD